MQIDISGITALTRDRQTSIRLYYDYKKRFPDKSSTWVVEKVITDLQRDRGAMVKVPKIRTRSGNSRRSTELPKRRRPLPKQVALTSQKRWTLILIIGALSLGPVMLREFSATSQDNRFNFASPPPTKKIPQGSMLSIQNEAPEPLKVTLKGKQIYTFTLAACAECRYYNSEAETPQTCPDRGPKTSILVEPGTYDATVDYLGTTRTGWGTWTMVDKMEHSSCFWSIREGY